MIGVKHTFESTRPWSYLHFSSQSKNWRKFKEFGLIGTLGAHNSSVFIVVTIVIYPSSVVALCQWALVSCTLYVIHPYFPLSSPESCRLVCCHSTRKSKLTANYVGVSWIPVIITNCSPGSTVKHFHSAQGSPTVPTYQSNWQEDLLLASWFSQITSFLILSSLKDDNVLFIICIT